MAISDKITVIRDMYIEPNCNSAIISVVDNNPMEKTQPMGSIEVMVEDITTLFKINGFDDFCYKYENFVFSLQNTIDSSTFDGLSFITFRLEN